MRLGVDLGGTKIEVLALADSGQVLLRRRVPTPRGDYAATLAAIAALVRAAETQLGEQGSVGIGIPGTLVAATGLVKNANSTCLIGRPLQRDLEDRLARPVRVANDANCFALSEAIDGAGAGARAVFGVILGTGVGGGLVLDGRVWEGANGIAGEWGHNPLPGEGGGPSCYCGRQGCIETWLSGPGLAADHARHGGERLDPAGIVAAAAAGDAVASASLARYETRLARALAGVINVFDPEVIVLGGGLSRIERWYQRVPQLWGEYVFSDTIRTRLCPPRHGDSSGVRGAAWLWPAAA
ncbi:MAG: ROK family protein [Azovibrio sp.]|nr:ROK family protein [Azovibrio sp.]